MVSGEWWIAIGRRRASILILGPLTTHHSTTHSLFGVHQSADMDIKPGHFPDRVGLQGLFVAEMLVAVKQHAELSSPITQVVVGDDAMAEKAMQSGQRVAN